MTYDPERLRRLAGDDEDARATLAREMGRRGQQTAREALAADDAEVKK